MSKEDAQAFVNTLCNLAKAVTALPDGTTREALEAKFWQIDDLVCAFAPDGPLEIYDEWHRLRSLMTPEFRRERDRIRGVVNNDYGVSEQKEGAGE